MRAAIQAGNCELKHLDTCKYAQGEFVCVSGEFQELLKKHQLEKHDSFT